MAGIAEIPRFEEMIAAVGRFINEVSEACKELAAAGNECVENCDNDNPSVSANAKLTNCIKKLDESLETAEKVKAGLQQELESLYELLRKSEAFEAD